LKLRARERIGAGKFQGAEPVRGKQRSIEIRLPVWRMAIEVERPDVKSGRSILLLFTPLGMLPCKELSASSEMVTGTRR